MYMVNIDIPKFEHYNLVHFVKPCANNFLSMNFNVMYMYKK